MNPSLFTTLAEPNRLNIVELLRKGPRPVNEIVHHLRLNQPQVSKHLKVLADAGMVDVHPDKNQRIYSLKTKPFRELNSWLEKYRALWEDRFERVDMLIELEKKKK